MSRVSREWYNIVLTRFPSMKLDMRGKLLANKNNFASLLSCPFLEQVRWLDLSINSLTEEDVIELAKCNKFKKLEELILSMNDFSFKCVEAFAESSYIRQMKYIDLRNVNFAWKDEAQGTNFINSQPEEMRPFWYLVLGNCGTLIVPNWLLIGGIGNSWLHCETQLELGEYCCFTLKNAETAIEWFGYSANNELSHNRAIALFSIGRVFITLGEKYHSKAFQYFLQAANLGDVVSYLTVANFLGTGCGVEQNPKESLKWYLKYVDSGGEDEDGFVSHQIGSCYYECENNYSQALRWWESSMEKGYSNAKYSLGTLYLNGEGVEKDLKKAIALLEEASREGIPEAQTTLGAIYLEGGESIEVDTQKAKDLFLSASDADDADAKYNLGIIAESEGRYEEALEWYKESLKLGNNIAGYAIGKNYFEGKGVPKDERKGIEYTLIAANDNDIDAQTYLGDIYFTESNDCYNPRKAIEWYTKAAELGSMDGMYNAGCVFEKLKNLEMAIYWYSKAAELGNSSSMNNLAIVYYEAKNYEKALEWMNKSIEKNNSYALCTMGEWYVEGCCVEKNFEKAFEYFTKACQFGEVEDDTSQLCPASFFYLHLLYLEGNGCTQDLEKAQELLEKAASFGEEKAIELLEEQSKKRKTPTTEEKSPKKMK